MHEPERQPVRPTRTPWVWVAIGVIAVAAIGVSALHYVTAACAAVLTPSAAVLTPSAAGQNGPPLAAAVTQGRAVFYNQGDGQGSCSFGLLPAGGLYVSLGAQQYAGGAACGSYLSISGPAGRVLAEVVDNCPSCTNGGIDMSAAAFSKIANPSDGTALVSYRVARDPRLPGPLAFRVGVSATSGWLAIQVLNQGNPLAAVEVRPAGHASWQPLALSPDDYWVAAAGAGPGPFGVRVTDAFGHRVVAAGIRLAPGTVQLTGVPMYTLAAHAQRSQGGPPPSSAASTPPPATHGASPPGEAAHAASLKPSATAGTC
jgi:expansin (peptidoglycan-binding protein)